ncbi:MAG TPA: hypothetical protein VIK95_05835, partial [Egibacteraceae bacterium]
MRVQRGQRDRVGAGPGPAAPPRGGDVGQQPLAAAAAEAQQQEGVVVEVAGDRLPQRSGVGARHDAVVAGAGDRQVGGLREQADADRLQLGLEALGRLASQQAGAVADLRRDRRDDRVPLR